MANTEGRANWEEAKSWEDIKEALIAEPPPFDLAKLKAKAQRRGWEDGARAADPWARVDRAAGWAFWCFVLAQVAGLVVAISLVLSR